MTDSERYVVMSRYVAYVARSLSFTITHYRSASVVEILFNSGKVGQVTEVSDNRKSVLRCYFATSLAVTNNLLTQVM